MVFVTDENTAADDSTPNDERTPDNEPGKSTAV